MKRRIKNAICIALAAVLTTVMIPITNLVAKADDTIYDVNLERNVWDAYPLNGINNEKIKYDIPDSLQGIDFKFQVNTTNEILELTSSESDTFILESTLQTLFKDKALDCGDNVFTKVEDTTGGNLQFEPFRLTVYDSTPSELIVDNQEIHKGESLEIPYSIERKCPDPNYGQDEILKWSITSPHTDTIIDERTGEITIGENETAKDIQVTVKIDYSENEFYDGPNIEKI